MAYSPSYGKYAFTFDTPAEYIAAKGNGGAIYVALATGTEVSCSAVSFIRSTGETFVDSVNNLVPREDGSIGDLLLYKDGEFFWCTGGRKSWDSTSFGSDIIVSSRLSGYVGVGYMGARWGDKALIIAINSLSAAALQSSGVNLEGVTVDGRISRRDFYSDTRTFASFDTVPVDVWQALQAYPNTVNNPIMPFTKAMWETVCRAARNNEEIAQTTISTGYYKVTPGLLVGKGLFHVTVVAYTTLDIDPADFGYDFHRMYQNVFAMDAMGTRAESDMNGRGNTLALASAGTSPAASRCLAYSVDAEGFGEGSWWLPSMGELAEVIRNLRVINGRKGVGFDGNHYVSTKCSASSGWYYNKGTARFASSTVGTARLQRPVTYFKMR